MNAQIN